MKKPITIQQAKEIMGSNIIGPEELSQINEMKLALPENLPGIGYTAEYLEVKKKDYILVLGVSHFADGTMVTIRNLKYIFGKESEIKEPCFYNQDWYECEDFIDTPMKDEWFLIRKDVYADSRAVMPVDLMKQYVFPTAIKCAYSFFAAWFSLGIKLWYSDFVWCADTDHNGDRIYVGKYQDVDCVNKNGFSIHRHLTLRPCYGCID
jgi:hypothetical protein